jgi:hypothetical protein
LRNIVADWRRMVMGVQRCMDVLSGAMEGEGRKEWNVIIAIKRVTSPPIAGRKAEEKMGRVQDVTGKRRRRTRQRT